MQVHLDFRIKGFEGKMEGNASPDLLQEIHQDALRQLQMPRNDVCVLKISDLLQVRKNSNSFADVAKRT